MIVEKLSLLLSHRHPQRSDFDFAHEVKAVPVVTIMPRGRRPELLLLADDFAPLIHIIPDDVAVQISAGGEEDAALG